jgi:hypothetical protein
MPAFAAIGALVAATYGRTNPHVRAKGVAMHAARLRKVLALLCGATVAAVAGCIVCDQLTTITIYDDGSAEFIKLQTNIRSSEPGAKGEEELRGYVSQFNAREDSDHQALIKAGAVLETVQWLRRERPHANVITARLPNAAVLERLFTFHDDSGKPIVTARFSRDGSRRRFALRVALAPDDAAPQQPRTAAELRAVQSDGLSETRFAVSRGKIVGAKGFSVARDRQSALLEPGAILEALRTKREVEAFLEWDVDA